MTSWENYKPVTSEEHYLARIAAAIEELVALRKSEQATSGGEGGVVQLRETLGREASAVQATPLPADFPGKDALEAAGIGALEDVPRSGAELTAIPGIGAATANKILTWLRQKADKSS
jgi:hypothetical protein